MFITELDTFVRKFHQLWNDGVTAHLDMDAQAGNAWVGLRVHLGQVPGPPHGHADPPFSQQTKKESPSRKRRRLRRAAAAAAKAANIVVDEPADDMDEASEDKHEPKENTKIVESEVTNDSEKKQRADEAPEVENRRTCTLEFYPEPLENIDDFRNKVEDYFRQRNDVVEEVLECKVEEFGTRVKFRCKVRKRQWLRFFNDPKGCYSDLTGIRRVLHACRNLADCDSLPS